MLSTLELKYQVVVYCSMGLIIVSYLVVRRRPVLAMLVLTFRYPSAVHTDSI